MSNIVAFERKPRRGSKPSAQGSFQLLFFTGVRYERAEPVTAAPKRRRPARIKAADKRTA
jgi:hypothetical protein